MPALTQLASVVRNLPEVITAERLELLSLGLEELAEETALPSGPSVGSDTNTSLAPEDRPGHRRAAVELAAAISGLPGASAGKPRIVIDMWRRIAENDVLPEVRRLERIAVRSFEGSRFPVFQLKGRPQVISADPASFVEVSSF